MNELTFLFFCLFVFFAKSVNPAAFKFITRDRCYDHNFLRFSPIFCSKNWRFSQKPML
jgi:hypothetical protein